MSRTIPAILLTNLQAKSAENAILIEIFTTTVMRVTDSVNDLSYGGNDYAAGELVSFSLPEETLELSAKAVKINLTGVNLNSIGNLLENFFGKSVVIHLSSIANGIVTSAMQIFDGKIEDVTHSENSETGKNSLNLSVKSNMQDFQQVRGHKVTDDFQQTLYAGDKGFEFVIDNSKVSI